MTSILEMCSSFAYCPQENSIKNTTTNNVCKGLHPYVFHQFILDTRMWSLFLYLCTRVPWSMKVMTIVESPEKPSSAFLMPQFSVLLYGSDTWPLSKTL